MPSLCGVRKSFERHGGDPLAAEVALNILKAGYARPEWWNGDPTALVARAMKELVEKRTKAVKHVFVGMLVMDTDIRRFTYQNDNEPSAGCLYVYPDFDQAGYVEVKRLGALEAVHPRLPATLLEIALGALNGWLRVYDWHRALEIAERRVEFGDEEEENEEIVDIKKVTPPWLWRRPCRSQWLYSLDTTDSLARTLIERALAVHEATRGFGGPGIEEDLMYVFEDNNPPVPGLVAVIEENDIIHGHFDEERQYMLEVTPEPNFVVRGDCSTPEGVKTLFAELERFTDVLAAVGRFCQAIPGNGHLR